MTQSNEPTVEQMNEAIALFMGWAKKKAGEFTKDGYLRYTWELEYHASWDALMPVGKKIRDLLQDMLNKRPPHTACNGDLIEVDIHCAISEYNIEKAHWHIYQFIQWLNQQKQKDDR